MASLTMEQLQCSICLDTFKEPVTIPCGHNFCRPCILMYWSNKKPVCPLCKETFNTQPDLRVNTFISGLVRDFIASNTMTEPDLIGTVKEQKNEDENSEARVQQMIQARLKKMEEIKHSVEISRAMSERDVEQSEQVFTALLGNFESHKAEVTRELEEKQRAVETQAEELIRELEQEVSDLRGNTGAGLNVLPRQKLSGVSNSSTDLCWKTLSTIVSQLEDIFREEMRKIMDKVLKELTKSAVDVTLDPDTANNFLSVSANGKQAQPVGEWINLPFSAKRFNTSVSVLGKYGFMSGKFYFLVQVSGKTDWGLGIVKETANRKGKITPSPRIGYWTVWLANGNEYKAAEDSTVSLCLREKPQKVGVFVDYEEGLVSFYDVEARAHMYSFTGFSFRGERLLPFLSNAVKGLDQNTAPLVILPISHRN